jgi:hypothetical protein
MSLLPGVHALLTFASWGLAISFSTSAPLKWLAIAITSGCALLFSRVSTQRVWYFGASAGLGVLIACDLALRISPEDDLVTLIGLHPATAFYAVTASSVLIAVTLAMSGAWLGRHINFKSSAQR